MLTLSNLGGFVRKIMGMVLIAVGMVFVLIFDFFFHALGFLSSGWTMFDRLLGFSLGVLAPAVFLIVGFIEFRKGSRLDKEKKVWETQVTQERRALELETVRAQRERIATKGVDLQQVPVAKEREVIREREIVKIRCRYCGKLYVETADKCPHCGATT